MTRHMANARYESLDAIRGVAVMGILAMNIVTFALPMSAYFNPAAGGPPSPADVAAWTFNFIFIDSKMRGLFSLLFGASTLLVIEHAEAAGRSAARTHYARMLWLGVFGLVHFYFIWFGDILSLYAVCGLLLYPFRNLSIRALSAWAAGFLIAAVTLMGAMWLSMAMIEAGHFANASAAETQRQIADINAAMGPNSSAYAKDISHYRGSYASIAAKRMTGDALEPLVQVALFLWESMGLMLIGMALFKARMLTGEWRVERYRKWSAIAFLCTVPPLAGLAWYNARAGFGAVETFGTAMVFSTPFDIAMTIGWAAAILYLIRTAASPAIRARLAAAGQMAFTNYLTTSIVMTTIFDGYGLGLFGSVPRAALYLFCLGMWAAMLLWSRAWLARYHYGPFEWLWRSLARGSLQPMRRAPA